MTADQSVDAPQRPDYREVRGKCGKCGRQVGVGSSSGKGRGGVWRCPYTDCRVWLRGLADPPPKPKKHEPTPS